MANLRNSTLFILLFWLSTSCTLLSAQKYSINTYPSATGGDTQQVITVSSDHIQQKCIFLNAEAENSWRHQYFMYILNDKDEVIPVMHNLNQDKTTCEAQIKKIEKIYQTSSEVRICLRGDIKKYNQYPEQITFGKLGSHTTKYDELWFQAICNTKNCYTYDSLIDTCPGFQLSHKKK